MRVVGAGLCLLLVCGAAPASAAPAALLNKSVSVSYAVTIPSKKADGTPATGTRQVSRTLYISSAGRVFARYARREGSAAETKDRGPGEGGFRFAGDKLVGVMQFQSGAAQMTVSFGPSGQSCSASIIAGRDNGHAIRWKTIDGSIRESTGPVAISNISCSIASGNAFGG